MKNDLLSEMLDLIEVRSIISGSTAASGRWETESSIDEDLKFFAVVQGRARLTTDGPGASLILKAGDVAVLNGRRWLRLEGGSGDAAPQLLDPPASGTLVRLGEGAPGTEDIVIGGLITVNATGRELLLQALPSVAHIRSGTDAAPHLHDLIDRLFAEVSSPRAGSAFAVRQYGQLLLVEVIRAFMQNSELPRGWLKLVADERLRPAVALIHNRISRPPSLEELARAAAMSRTAFTERFREAAGTPPRSYLNQWRMMVAQRELQSGDARIRSLALDLGYASESAFSTAFRRSVGESPLRYRSRMRAPQPLEPKATN